MNRPAGKNRLESLLAKARPDESSERVRTSAVLAVTLAVALLVWLLFVKGDGDSSEPAANPGTAGQSVSLVPESGLLDALEGVGYPIYWAGPRLGVEYEVLRLPEGRTYLRYLPEGEEIESKRPFLTVGSYEESGALQSIRSLGRKPGAVLVSVAGGGSAYAEGPDATSAYMAFPGVGTQIEVFDPEEGKALRLIKSGAIVPVG
jgi:hypothetical protein